MAAQVDSAPRTGAPHLRTDSSRREIGEEAVTVDVLFTVLVGSGAGVLARARRGDGSVQRTSWRSLDA